MSVEINGLGVGACLFGMVIWVDCFVHLEHDFVGKMIGARVVRLWLRWWCWCDGGGQ